MHFEEYASEQVRLKALLLKRESFDRGVELCLTQNAQLHASSTRSGVPTIWDRLIEGLTPEAFVFRPEMEFESIAWCTWHITRIEDAVGNLLIAESDQVFNARWRSELGVSITDTGNAFARTDVDSLGRSLNLEGLLRYRSEVGRRSQEIIGALRALDIRKKPSPTGIQRIVQEGVLTSETDSLWLKDFWAGKTIGGLLLLPMTRHQLMHIPNCFRLKALAAGADR